MNRTMRRSFASAALAIALTSSTQGEPPPATAPQPAQGAESEPRLISQQAVSFQNLGLSIHLPEDSLIQSTSMEGMRSSIVVRPPEGAANWVIQLHNSLSSDPDLSPTTVIDDIIQQWRRTRLAKDACTGDEVGSYVRVFGRMDDLVIGDAPARRVYLDVPSEPAVPVTGFTVIQTGPSRFVIAQLDSPRQAFDGGARHLYETVVASARFVDQSAAASDRAALVLAGDAFIQSTNAEDLEACLAEAPEYFRVYRPSPTGVASDAEEVAWQRIQLRLGQLGELSPEKSKDGWGSDEREFGYLARVDARSFVQGSILDSEGIFYLSRDRLRERWSIRNVVSKGESRQFLTLTAVRRDRRMTILTEQSGQAPRQLDYDLPEQGYLSKVELYVLPRLIARREAALALGFYVYDPALGKLTLRREIFSRTEGPTSDPASGGWRQETFYSEDALSPAVALLDPVGRILRQDMGEGKISEPIEQARLQQIWKDLNPAPASQPPPVGQRRPSPRQR